MQSINRIGTSRIVVTGAAGSVGAGLCAALAKNGCAALGMLDHTDHGLLQIAEKVAALAPELQAADMLCDIRDSERLNRVLAGFAPDIVIHCAALKHVHFGERHPGECVLTNLIGVRNAVTAAIAAGARTFLLVSTDKAAAPVCTMGATKRLAELYLAGLHREFGPAIELKSVRFGNVMGSQGSVVPRFAAQIDADGPLQITHPDMKRFFMSLEDAVSLILKILVLRDDSKTNAASYFMDMGDPVSIVELGRRMIALSGRAIAIEYTGLRPGERLEEQLYDEFEDVTPSGVDGVHRLRARSAASAVTSDDLAELETVARTLDDAIVRQRVFALLDARLGRELAAVG